MELSLFIKRKWRLITPFFNHHNIIIKAKSRLREVSKNCGKADLMVVRIKWRRSEDLSQNSKLSLKESKNLEYTRYKEESTR